MGIYWKKGPFFRCIFTQLWIGLARTEQGQSFPFLTVLFEEKWRVQTLEFLFFKWRCWKPLHSALEQKLSLLKCCMGVKAEGHPGWLWERRARGCSAALGILWVRKAPKDRGNGGLLLWEAIAHGRKTAWSFQCSPASQESRGAELQPQVVPRREVLMGLVCTNNSTAGQEFLNKVQSHSTQT